MPLWLANIEHRNMVVALCISVPEKSMISGGYRSPTLFTYYFQFYYLFHSITILFRFNLLFYSVSTNISILGNSL
jgi:hypothetical protein